MPLFPITRGAVTCKECGEDKPRDGATKCTYCGCTRFAMEPNGCWLNSHATREDSILLVTVKGHDITRHLTADERRDALKLVIDAAVKPKNATVKLTTSTTRFMS